MNGAALAEEKLRDMFGMEINLAYTKQAEKKGFLETPGLAVK